MNTARKEGYQRWRDNLYRSRVAAVIAVLGKSNGQGLTSKYLHYELPDKISLAAFYTLMRRMRDDGLVISVEAGRMLLWSVAPATSDEQGPP